jgi:protein-S-isoprenylcysteine O-methyltransferase Ste14
MRVGSILLGLSWVIFGAYWLVSARGVKPSRSPPPVGKKWLFGAHLIIGLGLIAFWLAGMWGEGSAPWFDRPKWPFSPTVGAAAVILSYAGLSIALWARTALGRNWSALPELKQGHQLVTTGPYAVVRHPIYTGLLLMFAAIAVLWEAPAGLFLLLVAGIVLGLLAREETLLAGEFPGSVARLPRPHQASAAAGVVGYPRLTLRNRPLLSRR